MVLWWNVVDLLYLYICCNLFSCMFVAFATDGPTLLSMVAASGSIFAEMPSIFGSSFFFKDRAMNISTIKH